MELYFADTKYKTVKEIIENGYALHRDFEMNVLEIAESMPTLWSHTLNVPGRSEIVDFTDVLNNGKPSFKDRKITISLEQEERERWYKKMMHFARKVHGRKFNIMRSDDQEHYYTGRVILDAKRLNVLYNQYNLTITCDPYRNIVPGLNQLFNDFAPVDAAKYDVYIGEYCGTIIAEVTLESGRTSGYIRFHEEGKEGYDSYVALKNGTNTFLINTSGHIRFSFRYVQKITLSGNNLEV